MVLLLLFGKLVQSLPYPYNYTKSCRLSLAGSDARRYAFVQHAHTLYVHTQNMHIALHLSHSMYTREPAQYKGKMCTIALIR